MNKKTLKALKESIEHWYRISACKTREEVDKEGWHAEACPLCERFVQYCCDGCPVSKKTGETTCLLTPWIEADKVLKRYVDSNEWYEESQKAIEAEIRFLENLLPKGHRYWEGDKW